MVPPLARFPSKEKDEGKHTQKKVYRRATEEVFNFVES